MSKARINSVSTPTAQTNKLCVDRSVAETAGIQNSRINALNRNEPLHIRVIISMLQLYGLRISEVLSLKPSNITFDGKVIIKGAKGSSDRLVVIPEYSKFFIDIRNSGYNPFVNVNRFVIYRILKKYSLVSQSTYGSKNAVCHQFRYTFAKSINDVTGSVNETAQIIGHKKSSSTSHYLKQNGK